MKVDKLKQYVALRESLLKEKAALESRLAQINRALGCSAAPQRLSATAASAGPRIRAKNPMSLKAAVIKVTSARPLTKPEIMAAIKKLGYRFTGKDPMNSLNVVLYTKRQFKNDKGKFSPMK